MGKEIVKMPSEKNTSVSTPLLIPYEPAIFWQMLRLVIREEMAQANSAKNEDIKYKTPGMVYKPLYKITEVCELFDIKRQTIYDWVKAGKLKPHKIKSRVFFLSSDIDELIASSKKDEAKISFQKAS